MVIDSGLITGSLSVSGSYTQTGNAVISGSLTVTGNINATITGSITTASYALSAETLDGLDSTVFTLTSSFQNYTSSANTRLGALEAATASLYTATASFGGRVGALEAQSASLLSYTSSLNARTSSFATTGSNAFIGTQTITGSINQSGSITSTGTITAQTLIVQTVTSSTVYSSGSNIFGNNLANTQAFTGSLLVTGSNHTIFGNVGIGITGSSAFGLDVNSAARVQGNLTVGNGTSGSIILGDVTITKAAGSNLNAGNAGYITTGAGTFGTTLTAGQLILGNNRVSDTYIGQDAAGKMMKFLYNGNNIANVALAISTSGSVLINTTTEAGFKLDVSGSTRFNGNSIITGSLTVITGSAIELLVTNTGVRIGNAITDIHTVTGSLSISGSTTATSFTGSLLGTASYANNADTLDGLDSTVFATTGSVNAYTASINAFSASILSYTSSASTRLSALEAATASLYTATASFSGRVGALEAATASIYTTTSSLNASIASLNAATASLYTTTSSLNAAVSSLNNATSSLNTTTASLNAAVSSLNSATSSLNTTTASLNAAVSSLNSATSSLNTTTASLNASVTGLNAQTASLLSYTSSNNTTNTTQNTRLSALEAATASIYTTTSSLNASVAGLNTYTSSLNARTASFATTGSNTFTGVQYVSNNSQATSFTSTASIYTDGGMRVTRDAYVSGTLYLNNLTVFGTQSVNFITSSQLNISTNIITVNTSLPTVRFGGLAVQDSGSTGLTGSILWDSQDNQWIYSNPSGSAYDSALFLVGPRSTGALGSEVGITTNALAKGDGMHHMTSSGIFEVSGNVGIGTSSPGYKLDVVGEARITGSVIGNQGGLVIGGGFGTTTLSNTPSTTGAVIGTYLNTFAFIDLATQASNGSWIDFSSGSGDDYQGRIRYNNSLQSMYFYTNANSTPLVSYTSANVGIGTTTPAAKLDIRGGSDGDGMISIGGSGVSGIINSPTNMYINADSGNGYSAGIIGFGFNRTGFTGGTEVMRILEGGSVGIGTTSAVSRLTVSTKVANAASPYASGDSYIALTNTAHTDIGSLVIADNGNTWLNSAGNKTLWLNWYAVNNASSRSDLRVGDGFGGTEILSVIGSTRRVGINSSSPGYTLDVKGNMYVSASASGNPLIVDGQASGWVIFRRSGKSLYLNANYSDLNSYAQVSPLGSDNMGLSLSSRETLSDLFITGSTGYIGIGTITPASNLHIYNAGQPPVNDGLYANVILDTDSTTNYQRIRFDVGTTPYWGLGREGSTNDFILSGRIGSTWSDGAFKIQQSSGNVGIGTTSPGYRLDINGGATDTTLAVQTTGQNAVRLRLTNEERSFILTNNPGDDLLSFNYDGSNRLQFNTTNQWFNSGNVGIGTTSPISRLEVRAPNTGATTNYASKNIIATSPLVGGYTGAPIVSMLAMYDGTIHGADIGYLYDATGYGLAFSVNNDTSGDPAEAMRINRSGNVGIGTTSPQTNLQVYQVGGVGNNYVEGTIQVGGTTSALGGAFSYAAQSSGYVNITNLNNGGGANARISFGFGAISSGLPANNVMTINQSGLVGIGTTAPNQQLVVSGSSTDTRVEIGSSSTQGLYFTKNGANNGTFRVDTNGNYEFYTKNVSQAVVITAGGNVGIGTTSPSYTLQVNGTGYFNSTLYVNGATTVDDNFYVTNGNVGIGTTSTSTRLTVLSDASRLPASTAFAGLTTAQLTLVGSDGGLEIFSQDDNTTWGHYLTMKRFNGSSGNLIAGFGFSTFTNTGSPGSNTFDRMGIHYGTNAYPQDNAELMSIKAGGDVGIGTSNPDNSKLRIRADHQSGYSILSIQPISNNTATMGFYNSSAARKGMVYTTDTSLAIETDGLPIDLSANGNPRVRVTTGGNVGIGTTSPQGKLDITGGSGDLLYLDAGFNTDFAFKVVSGADDALVLRRQHSTQGDLSIASFTYNGNVGVGTIVPSTKLHVVHTNLGAEPFCGIIVKNTSTTGAAYTGLNIDSYLQSHLRFSLDGSLKWQWRVGAGAGTDRMDLYSWTAGADVMSILNNGNVGIGSTSPSAKFNVNNSGGTGNAFYVDAGNTPGNQVLFEHSGANTPVPFTIRKSGYVGSSNNFGVLYIDMAHNVAGGGSNLHFTLRDSAGGVQEYGGLGATITTNTAGGMAGALNFYTTNAGSTRLIRMRIAADGAVGIGTTSPAYTLDVTGTGRFTSTLNVNDRLVQGTGGQRSTSGTTIALTNNTTFSANSDIGDGQRFLSIVNESTTTSAFSNVCFRINPGSGGSSGNAMLDMKFVNNGSLTSTLYWTFNHGGSFGDKLSLTSAGTLTAAGDVVAFSDARLKENVITVDNAVEKVLAMRGVFYNKKEDETKSRKVGVIAQEIQEILPEVVTSSADGTLGVAYGNIVGVLIEAIKEQQQQIDELKYLLQTINK